MTAVKLPETETRVKSITVTAEVFADRAHGLVVRTVIVLPEGEQRIIENVEAMPLRTHAHFWGFLAADTIRDLADLMGCEWEKVPWKYDFIMTFKETVQEALKGVGIE